MPRIAGAISPDDAGDGREDAPAGIAIRVAVPEFQCLARSGGCAGGRQGFAVRAAAQNDIGPYRGVAAGVEDFLGRHVTDDAHGIFDSM